MNEQLVIKVLEMLLGAPQAITANHPAIGEYCIIRTHSAGVHAGTVSAVSDGNITLCNSRRIWKWGGAFSLSEVSQKGIDKDKSRVACEVPVLYLTDAIEIIPTTNIAREKIEACDAK